MVFPTPSLVDTVVVLRLRTFNPNGYSAPSPTAVSKLACYCYTVVNVSQVDSPLLKSSFMAVFVFCQGAKYQMGREKSLGLGCYNTPPNYMVIIFK